MIHDMNASSDIAPVDTTKVNDFRRQSTTAEAQDEDIPPRLSQDRRGWTFFVQLNSVRRTYRKRLTLNNDIKVAALEVTIMLLSVAQLQWSYNSPHWREKRACTLRPGCVDTLPDNSFAVANVIRVTIAALALARLFIRFSLLWTKFDNNPTIRSKMTSMLQYGLELVCTAIFPYPWLETFFPKDRGDSFVMLSASVFARSISWGQWLYYPYPIRQKEKVASFSGSLEFSYRQFVIKKVLDDNPLSKLVTFYTLLGAFVAYFLGVMETVKGHCTWKDVNDVIVRSEDAICYELHISDSLWMVFMTFLSIGYGDVFPKTVQGRVIISLTAFVAVLLDAIFCSIIIKKFSFSTLEARVHSFLYRMELCSKKEVSAVMAVQATYRYSKSYKHSLIWHQEHGSSFSYRPLSDRLPNEVKTKLYASRFQQSLKQIMKYNTDGDPLNTFSKHAEVISAALGATFTDMAHLKKTYFRQIRALEQRRQHANRRSTSIGETSIGCPLIAPNGEVRRNSKSLSTTTGLETNISNTSQAAATTASGGINAAWGDEMQRKCEATMLLLKKMEADIKGIHRNNQW